MKKIMCPLMIALLMSAFCDCSELNAQRRRDRQNNESRFANMMRMMPIIKALDVNEDGELSAEEIERAPAALQSLDKNDDGKLTEDELRPDRSMRDSDRRRDERESRGSDNAPKVGDEAPPFKLKSLDGKSKTDLAKFKGKKPVVLLFGSYT